MRIAILYWNQYDGIATMLADGLRSMEHTVIPFNWNAVPPMNVDIILAHGPFGSLSPLICSLATIRTHTPKFILWQTEQMPNPQFPKWWWRVVGSLLSRVDEKAYLYQQSKPSALMTKALMPLSKRGNRYRYFGDFFRLKRVLPGYVLGISSRITTEQLREVGLDPITAQMGYCPEYGEIREVERDIPVLWLGKIATRRRQKILIKIRRELSARGIEMLMIDGVENPYVFGEERTALLNRAKIMLNVVREPWDNNAMRFYFAGANGSMIITEPILPHTPFEPGVHMVMAPIEQIPDLIVRYLNDEPARQQLAANAHALLTGTLTLNAGIVKLLEAAVTKSARNGDQALVANPSNGLSNTSK